MPKKRRDRPRKMSLRSLFARVQKRVATRNHQSYTRSLLRRGLDQCAKKFGEEAVELTIASLRDRKKRVVAESADVLYHLSVLWHARGVSLADVEEELFKRSQRRAGRSHKRSV